MDTRQDAPAANAPGAETEQPIDRDTLDGLEKDAHTYGRRGALIFLVALLVGAALLVASHFLTMEYVDDLQEAKDSGAMLTLLLVRGVLFGTLAVAFLYGVLTMATAYIDQATRFRKRIYSAHMLNYVFSQYSDQVRDKTVTLRDFVEVFSAWNENVDSAFSSVRFQRKSKDFMIGRNGIALREPPDDEQDRKR
jgi:phosphoglycerol transferase MdoB-like AlkP superfamily enzyme